jgi:long-chain acyl-CoA synthetase
VLGPDGTPLPPGQSGEVACGRDDYPDFTYHGDDAKRRSAARGPGGALVATGDVGFFDADGYLYLDGRASDMIIFGGTNIDPAEIEQALMRLPGVADCAVFGIPDDRLGEEVAAAIVLHPGASLSEDELRAFLAERIAKHKIPAKVWFLTEQLPRNANGKFLKRELRKQLAGV